MMLSRTTICTFVVLTLLAPMPLMAQGTAPSAQMPVTVQNFNRVETDAYFGRMVKQGAFGKFHHNRDVASIDKQDVVRMNRDTLYSAAVFDLDASPVTITMPDAGDKNGRAIAHLRTEIRQPRTFCTRNCTRPGNYRASAAMNS